MEVAVYSSFRREPSFGLVIRILIGIIVGLIGGPLWVFLVVQVGFEFYRTIKNTPSEYPALNIGAAILGWLIGRSS